MLRNLCRQLFAIWCFGAAACGSSTGQSEVDAPNESQGTTRLKCLRSKKVDAPLMTRVKVAIRPDCVTKVGSTLTVRAGVEQVSRVIHEELPEDWTEKWSEIFQIPSAGTNLSVSFVGYCKERDGRTQGGSDCTIE